MTDTDDELGRKIDIIFRNMELLNDDGEDCYEDIKQKLTQLNQEVIESIKSRENAARINELNTIQDFINRLDDNYGEFDCLDDIEKHVANRLADLTKPKRK